MEQNLTGNTFKVIKYTNGKKVFESPSYPNFVYPEYLSLWNTNNADGLTRYCFCQYWSSSEISSHDDIVAGNGIAGVDQQSVADWPLPYWFGYSEIYSGDVLPQPRSLLPDVTNGFSILAGTGKQQYGYDPSFPNGGYYFNYERSVTIPKGKTAGLFNTFFISQDLILNNPPNERANRYSPINRLCVLWLPTPIEIGPLDEVEIVYNIKVSIDSLTRTQNINLTLNGVVTNTNVTINPIGISNLITTSIAHDTWRVQINSAIYGYPQFDTQILQFSTSDALVPKFDVYELTAGTVSSAFNWSVANTRSGLNLKQTITVPPQDSIVSPAGGWKSMLFINSAGGYQMIFDTPLVIPANNTLVFSTNFSLQKN